MSDETEDTGRNIKAKSFIGKVVRERDEKVKALSLELPIPTWGKKLLWGFQPVPRKALEDMTTGPDANKRDFETDITTLIDNTNGFWLFDPSHAIEGTRLGPDPFTGADRSKYVRLEFENGQPIPCDDNLAEALDFKPTDSSPLAPSTQLVMHLFKENATAIGSFVGRLVMWTQNTDLDVTKAQLGE